MNALETQGDSGGEERRRRFAVMVVGYVLGEVTTMPEVEANELGERLVRRLDEWGLSVVPNRFVDPAAYRA